MSLINEKRYDIYDYKPSSLDNVIDTLHKELNTKTEDIQNSCPSCTDNRYNFAFDKYNFHYVQCQNCMSLYVQNRLSKSEVVQYEQKLKTKLYLSQEYEDYLNSLMNKMSLELELFFSRLFNKKQKIEVAYFGNKSKVYEFILKDFNINFSHLEQFSNVEDNKYDLIIVDHILEKSINANEFLDMASMSLKDDGYVYLALRVGSGIDILTLWEDSKIYPMEHSNLFSLDGIKILFESNKLFIKELNTPGVLDIDNILATKSKEIPRFLSYLKETNNVKAIEEFQTFIQKNLLSSFATIIAQRK